MGRNVKKGFRFGDYKDAHKRDLRLDHARPVSENENLTFEVQGQKASDLEQRAARGMNRYRIPYIFQVKLEVATSLPNEQKRIDFLVRDRQPVEIDGFIGHFRTIGQKAANFTRDLFLNEALEKHGLERVLHIPYWKLQTQEQADKTIKDLRL